MTSARVRSFREASRAALASVRRNMRHVVKHRIAAHTVLPKIKSAQNQPAAETEQRYRQCCGRIRCRC